MQKAEDMIQQETALSEIEKAKAANILENIDLNDSTAVLQYGAALQKKIAEFSDSALANVRTKDLGETGEMITGLMAELKGFSADEKEERGFFGLLKSAGNRVARLKTRYDRAENNVEKIVEELEKHQNRLLKDIVMLDKMYDMNREYFRDLTVYIMAGKEKLETEREVTLQRLKEKAEVSGQAEDAQRMNDFEAMCQRFEKKLHDLELTRTVCMQMAPQIRLIQNNNTLMSEKIQSIIQNTIPLWKNQMVLALGMEHSRQAMEAQREVTDMTNELLRKNAAALKAGTMEVAKESERSVVDLETLRYTNEQLIGTLDEVLAIQEEGRRKRAEAEAELVRMEVDLKNKLLEAGG